MRIVIDLQGAQSESRFRGIGRYSLSLALAIAQNAKEHEIWLVLNAAFPESILDIRHAFDGLIPQAHIRIFEVPQPVAEHKPENSNRVRVAENIREYFLLQLNPDVVLNTSLFEGYVDNAVTSVGMFTTQLITASILYDLIPLHKEKTYLTESTQKEYYYRKIDSLKKCDLLLAISDFTHIDGVQLLDFSEQKIINISSSIDDRFNSNSRSDTEVERLKNRYGIRRKTIMYAPGGFDDRKNFSGLINAYALLSNELRKNHQLVIVSKVSEGDAEYLNDLRTQAELDEDELVLTGYVSDDDLVALYNLTTIFVFPSTHEGFGLPVLEAMACGAPTIGSNTTSIPEVIGWDQALFDPMSTRSIADKLTEFLTDETLLNKLRDHGLQQAKKFSWDASAKAAISALEDVYQEKKTTLKRSVATHILLDTIAGLLPREAERRQLVDLSLSIAHNHPQVNDRQLFVDVSELSQRDSATGVQRVTRSILWELLNRPPFGFVVEPVYATPQCQGYFYARKFTAKLLNLESLHVQDLPLQVQQGDVFLGLDLQHHVVISQKEYFDQLEQEQVDLFFMVYDLLPIHFKEYFSNTSFELHSQWLDIVTKYRGVICISETVSQELKGWLKKNHPERESHLNIEFSHIGADIESSLPTSGIPKDAEKTLHRIQSRISFMMVGTIEPRKGYAQVLSAFELLWSDGININLILVGKQGWQTDELVDNILNHPEKDKRLFWLNDVSDEYLKKIYRFSSCLIAASVSEGFGLPLIEAAQQKKPIIARNIPVFKEVAGENALYFDGKKPEQLAATVKQWLDLFKLGHHPESDNMPWVTWRQSADRLMDIILSHSSHDKIKRILVDVSLIVKIDAKSGIQRVVRSILLELLNNPPSGYEVKPIYFDDLQYRYATRFLSGFLNKKCDEDVVDDVVEFSHDDIYLALDLNSDITRSVHSIHSHLQCLGVRLYFVVYDILLVHRPDWWLDGSSMFFVEWLKNISEVATGLLCISDAVANEVTEWLKENQPARCSEPLVSSFHLGADVENSKPSKGLPDNAPVVLKSLNEKVSFLMVGTIEPRKGHQQTLSAFELLWLAGVDVSLVIVGREGWLVDKLVNKLRNHTEIGKRLFWLDGISDEYLDQIYAASTCLIAASEGEGFGLPLIEAAQHKTPIIARDLPVFREVAGKYAYYFNGLDFESMSKVITRWLELNAEGKAPTSANMPWLTWKESCKSITNLIVYPD